MNSIRFLVPLLYALPAVAFAQAPAGMQLFWSQAGTDQVSVQVQDFPGEVPPVIRAYPLAEGQKGEPVKVPELKAMAQTGFWEASAWDVSKLKPGLYFLGQAPPEAGRSLLATPGIFETVGAEILHQEGVIRWAQPSTGMARVLLQSTSGLMIGSPADWMMVKAGDASVKWDGKGVDGVDYRFQPGVTAVVQIARAQQELLVVGDAAHPAFASSAKKWIDSLKLPSGKNLKFRCKALNAQGVEQHGCEPGGALKVELPPETAGALQGKRFEILVYVDGVFIHEESQGVNPYLYRIPSTVPGDSKTVSVNLIDYEGASGIVTLPFERPK